MVHKKAVRPQDLLTSFVAPTEKRPWTDDECRKYYRALQATLDRQSDKKELTYRIDLSEYTNRRGFSGTIKRALGVGDGQLYFETVVGFIDATEKMLSGNNVSILGLVQSAKTAVQCLSGILASVRIWLDTRKITTPLFVTPVGRTYIGQFRSKLIDTVDCLKDAVIVDLTAIDNEISIADYIDELSVFRRTAIRGHIIQQRSILGKAVFNKVMKIYKTDFDNHDDFPVLTISPKNISFFKAIFNGIRANGGGLFFIRDEAHAAVKSGSVNDRILTEPTEEDISIYEAMNSSHIPFQCILTSATNWCSLHLRETVCIPVNKNYTGLDFAFMGYKDGNELFTSVANGVKIKPPKIMNIENFGKVCGDPWLKDFTPSWYGNESVFIKECAKNEQMRLRYQEDHSYYQECMEAAFVESMHYFYRVNPHRGQGCLVRIFNNREDMNNLIARVQPRLDKNIKIIRGYDNEYDTVTDLLEENQINKNDFYIIFVVAKGRMADTYPASCCYGFDLTRQSSNLAALIQGTLGRMMGYFKKPLVILSARNYRMVRKFINGGYTGAGQGKLSNTVISRSRKTCTFLESALRNIPQMAKLFQLLQTHAIDTAPSRTYKGKTLIRGGKAHYKPYWKVIEPYFEWINENLSNLIPNITSTDRLIHPNEYGERQYAVDEEGFPYIAIRSQGKGFHSNVGGKSGDDKIVVRITTRYNKCVIVGFDMLRNDNSQMSVEGDSMPGKIQ